MATVLQYFSISRIMVFVGHNARINPYDSINPFLKYYLNSDLGK
jgi:hypothetical protein